jgi:hypothetical protein
MVAGGACIVAAAIGWGSRIGDFNMFHLFFGGIALFGMPAAAVAIPIASDGFRTVARPLAAALLFAQLEIGAGSSVLHLISFGPHDYDAIPTSILRAIRELEPDAKLAYHCRTYEEIGIWDPRLASIDAHTGRRVIPMCFQANPYADMTGGRSDPAIAHPFFAYAPQADLFPDAAAVPTETEVVEFLAAHGVGYLFVDIDHPNTLIPSAVPVAISGTTQVLRIPHAAPASETEP